MHTPKIHIQTIPVCGGKPAEFIRIYIVAKEESREKVLLKVRKVT